jgi:signal transduction histidine kinase
LNLYELAESEGELQQPGPEGFRVLERSSATVYEHDPAALTRFASSDPTFVADDQRVGKFLKKLPAGPESVIVKPLSRSDLRTRTGNGAVPAARKRSKNVSSIGEHRSRHTRSLARVVHDLRTPLMASNGYCELLLGGAMGDLRDEQAELVERIRRSLGRLARMTEAMLQLGAGEAENRIQLKNAPIQACIEHALSETLPLTKKKDLTVEVDLDDALTDLPLDPEQIERVLINLIENSCKFTPLGGAIQIRAYPAAWQQNTNRPEDGGAPWGLRVDVIDSGSGIAREKLDRVFDEYVSYGGAENSSGRGLGLAICKSIVMAHQGRIWAENHPGGTRISFVLPAGSPEGALRSA